MIRIEIACGTPEGIQFETLELPDESTVIEALRASALSRRHPDILNQHEDYAIHGKAVSPQTLLRDGDRIEICRPLKADPKEARRRRAAQQRRLRTHG